MLLPWRPWQTSPLDRLTFDGRLRMSSIVDSLRQDHINSTNLLDVLEQQLVIFGQAGDGNGWRCWARTIRSNPLVYDVSPYLLVPCRDLPAACKQIRHARGLLTRPCGTCALSDMCKGAMRKEAEAVSQLPQLVKTKTSRAITRMSGRKAS